MKKIIFCLAVLFCMVSVIAQKIEVNYTPFPSSKIGKEWFIKNFILKNKLQISYDFVKSNDYIDQLSCIVLSIKDSSIAIFDYYDTSYLVSKHKTLTNYPNVFIDDKDFSLKKVKEVLQTKDIVPLTHKSLLLAYKEL